MGRVRTWSFAGRLFFWLDLPPSPPDGRGGPGEGFIAIETDRRRRSIPLGRGERSQFLHSIECRGQLDLGFLARISEVFEAMSERELDAVESQNSLEAFSRAC